MWKLPGLALLATAVGLAAVEAAPLDPSKPEDALKINRKIMCSLTDGEPKTYTWHGRAYSRRQGERDRLLFLVEGMNVRACARVEDEKRGEGFALVSRELLIYKDPKTGKPLATWDNPWTGETVDVLHVANDPVNFKMYVKTADGKPLTWDGDIVNGKWMDSNTVPLFYPNPLASAYQTEIGGTYHATEFFNFFGSAEDLLDPDAPSAEAQVGWTRMSDWLPWMEMGGREGIIYMHTAGLKLNAWDELSDTLKTEVKKHYPDYTAPPPVDDDRRNVTSWIYYKRVTEGEEEAPKRR